MIILLQLLPEKHGTFNAPGSPIGEIRIAVPHQYLFYKGIMQYAWKTQLSGIDVKLMQAEPVLIAVYNIIFVPDLIFQDLLVPVIGFMVVYFSQRLDSSVIVKEFNS